MLGQHIDFSELKAKVDGVFSFDLSSPPATSISKSITAATGKANKQIREKFGPRISDVPGFNNGLTKLHDIIFELDDLFERSLSENIAEIILARAEDAKRKLQERFAIDAEFDPAAIERLNGISRAIKSRPIIVTPLLLEWARKKDTFR